MRIYNHNEKSEKNTKFWTDSFLRALRLHGRPESRLKWYLIWADKFIDNLSDRLPQRATREDAERFLAYLASSKNHSGILETSSDPGNPAGFRL